MAEVRDVETSEGIARLTVHQPAGPCRATVALGHGAGGGADARDLATLATGLPGHGYRVILMDQPWRLVGRRLAVAPARLDVAWVEVWALAKAQGLVDGPFVVGGRSAGARVACRTALAVAAEGVLTLAFPLEPPRRPDSSRAHELEISMPLLVVQGERDRFGGPAQIARLVPNAAVVGVPGADHALAVTTRSVITQSEADELITDGCLRWLGGLGSITCRESTTDRPR